MAPKFDVKYGEGKAVKMIGLIRLLRGDPEKLAPKFDVKYGEGAAKKMLKAVEEAASGGGGGSGATQAGKAGRNGVSSLLSKVKPAHLEALMSDFDKYAAFFDEKYGEGAAEEACELQREGRKR